MSGELQGTVGAERVPGSAYSGGQPRAEASRKRLLRLWEDKKAPEPKVSSNLGGYMS